MSPQYRMGRMGGNSMFPPVIKGLLITNAVVFILQHFLGAYSAGGFSLGNIIFSYGALFPIESDNFYFWQILTYQFLHGDFGHIFFNMIMLWMFGVELENLWGERRFLIFYLLSGFGAALVQLFISPYLGSVGATVGASGSIYGIFLAFALSFPDRHIMVFPLFIPIKAKYLIIILVVMDFLMGFSAMTRTAHFAHIGGALTGFILLKYGDAMGLFRTFDKLFPPKTAQTGWGTNPEAKSGWGFSAPKKEPKIFKADWFKREEPKPTVNDNYKSRFHVNGEEIDQQKIDEILDKISATGYQNLTDREKAILFELSQRMK